MAKKISLLLLALILFATALGVRISHPEIGLSHVLGSAQSSIVIFKNGNDVSVGDKVMYESLDLENTPVLGVISSLDENSVSANNGSTTEVISRDALKGEVLFIIPFLGSIIGFVGL